MYHRVARLAMECHCTILLVLALLPCDRGRSQYYTILLWIYLFLIFLTLFCRQSAHMHQHLLGDLVYVVNCIVKIMLPSATRDAVSHSHLSSENFWANQCLACCYVPAYSSFRGSFGPSMMALLKWSPLKLCRGHLKHPSTASWRGEVRQGEPLWTCPNTTFFQSGWNN